MLTRKYNQGTQLRRVKSLNEGRRDLVFKARQQSRTEPSPLSMASAVGFEEEKVD
jgi:hypothetical protein